jgi:putative ABC transport system permease protein
MDARWEGRPLRHVTRRPSQIRAEVDEELRFHIEMRIAELIDGGLHASAAREEALRQFGDWGETREVCVSSDERRESSSERRRYLDELRQDIVHGARQLRQRWPVTVVAAITLAVGVGASTAIFSATDHVLLRPLPYAEPERIVAIFESDSKQGRDKLDVSPGNFLDWQRRSTLFESMGLVDPFSFDLITDGPPQAVSSWNVSSGYLESLGVQPVIGRLPRPEDYQRNAAATILISEEFWQRRFGGDRDVVGKVLRLDGRMASIIGVLPASLKYPNAEDLWAPKAFRDDEIQDRYSQYMHAVGKLKPGVTVAQAEGELNAIMRQLKAENPTIMETDGVRLIPLEREILGNVRPALLVLLGAVGFVLLIACANVASLLLAAGSERSKELAVRASLGAGRRRLLHQLATESVLLALVGGALALVFARLAVRAVIALSPPDLPRVESIAIDGRVLGFSLALTLITAVLFGLAPALRFSRPDLLSTLRASGRSVTAGRQRNRLRGALVVGEVALALMLLIGAGLLMRSFVRLRSNDLGFEPENRATLQAFLWDLNPTPELRLQKAEAIMAAMRRTPGVREVGLVSALPFHPHAIDANSKLQIKGKALPAGAEPTVFTTIATPTYFRAMDIPLKAGRMFDQRDRVGTAPVTVVNETLARRFFQGDNPVGKFINISVMARPQDYEVIGVVGDVRPVGLDSDPRPEMFVPFAQAANGSLTFVVQTERKASEMLPLLRERFWSVDNRQSIYWSQTIESMIGETLVERRFNLTLLAAFSAIALILASIGIYGLISFATQQRTNEIGVRMALGAERGEIVRMIVGQGLKLTLPGVILGIIGAFALTRFLQTMLYGVQPTDPFTFAQIAVLMVVVAAAAAYIPARRAVKASPLKAILTE